MTPSEQTAGGCRVKLETPYTSGYPFVAHVYNAGFSESIDVLIKERLDSLSEFSLLIITSCEFIKSLIEKGTFPEGSIFPEESIILPVKSVSILNIEVGMY